MKMNSENDNHPSTEDAKILKVEEYHRKSDRAISSNITIENHGVQNDIPKIIGYEKDGRKDNEGLETIREENELSEEEVQQQFQNSWQYISSIIVLSGATFLVMTVVPTHDIIRNPEYWWEIMVQWCFGNKLMKLIFYSIHCKTVLGYQNISSPRSMLKLFIFSAASTIIYCSVVHLVWTTYLGYNEPMALSGWLEGVISQIILMASVWFQFPTTWLSDPSKRRQLNFYFYYWLFEFSLVYHLFGFLFFIFPRIPNQFKPFIMAIFFILWREFIGFVMSVLIKKAGYNESSEFTTENSVAIMNMQVASRYHFQVLMLCSQLPGDMFTICLLAADFIFVMIMVARIIRLQKKINPTSRQTAKAREHIDELILSELIEIVIPLLFMMTFTFVYNGPNAYHMEGMRFSYWQQAPVKDLVALFYPTSFIFLGFDLTIFICSSIILYFGCNVNMIQEAKKVLVKFWFLIMLNLILLWNQYYSTKLLGTGNDLTQKWDWIQDGEERNAMLSINKTLT